MQFRKLKSLKAYNILCFGPEGIEIDFESMGNIVSIRGQNLDAFDSEEGCKDASNGSGKSSVIDVISYVLYGNTIKKPKKLKHADIINNHCDKKGLYGEVIIDDYKVIRTRKKTKTSDKGTLSLFKLENGEWEDISKGKGPTAVQQDIIDKVTGLNYETFVNIFVFGDDDSASFLELDTSAKREMVDNLLGLEKYRKWHDNAKAYVKQCKSKIKILEKEYEHLLVELETYKKRIDDIQNKEKFWIEKKKKEIEDIKESINSCQKKLKSSNKSGAIKEYADAQSTIASLKDQIPELDAKKLKLERMLESVAPKIKEFQDKHNKIISWLDNADIESKRLNKEIDYYTKELEKPGKRCPTCKGVYKKENLAEIITEAEKIVGERKKSLKIIEDKKPFMTDTLKELVSDINKYKNGIKEAENKLTLVKNSLTEIHLKIGQLSKIKEPDLGIDERLLQEQIDSFNSQIQAKQKELEGDSPYKDILQSAYYELKGKKLECGRKKEEINKFEELLPYYEFFIIAFGDNGIRRYIIDGIIPILNSRLNYLLQYLVNGKIKLTFDNKLEETVDRYPFDGKLYAYSGLSNGQRRRLALGNGQAFAHVMTASAGSCLSVFFLDEVCINQDRIGVQGIYRMICELSKDRQIFVIDHNENLLGMLDGCETVYLQMQNGITKRVDKLD